MAGRKNDLGIALALQHLFVHFLVAGLIAALAAGGIHNDFTAGGAGLRVECDAATLEFESAMDGVHRSSQRPLDFGLGGIKMNRDLLRRHHRRQQRQPGEPRDTARRHTGRVTVSSFDFPVSSAPAIVEPAKLWASIAGWLAGGHLFRLAVLRYNDLPAENVSRLSKGQVIGHWLEITAGFGLLHVDCLEEESFSFHVHRSTRPLWVSRRIWTSRPATWCKRGNAMGDPETSDGKFATRCGETPLLASIRQATPICAGRASVSKQISRTPIDLGVCLCPFRDEAEAHSRYEQFCTDRKKPRDYKSDSPQSGSEEP